MTPTGYSNLVIALATAGHDIHVEAVNDLCGTIYVKHPVFTLWIEERAAYCDRGRWMWQAESTDVTKATIDWADGFPRYYFHEDCLVRELTTWLEVRDRQLLKQYRSKVKASHHPKSE